MPKINTAIRRIGSKMPNGFLKRFIYRTAGVKIGKGSLVSKSSFVSGSTVIGRNTIINDFTRIIDCNIGDNVKISRNVILEKVNIGNGTTIESFTTMQGFDDSRIEIGNDSYISSHSTFDSRSPLKVGNHVSAGPHFSIVTHSGHIQTLSNAKFGTTEDIVTKPVSIGDHVYFGVDVKVLPGITIGDYCVINAGSLVTKSVSSHSFLQGTPAKKVGDISFKNGKPLIKKYKESV